MATRQQIAHWLGVKATSDAADLLHVASIEAADKHSVVFATSRTAVLQACDSQAGLILTAAPMLVGLDDRRLLATADPRLAFSIIAALLQSRPTPTIHPTAVIAASADLDPTVSVGAGSVIGAGVRVGAETTLGARVVLEAGITLGARVTVQAGAVLGSFGFGYARRPDGSYVLFPQQGTLVIEDDVDIGANTTIDRGALGETRIGRGAKIDNLVHIGHNCRIGRNVIVAAQTGISGSTVVDDGAILGGQVGIGEHAYVGPQVILGGGAGVLSNKKLHGPGQVFWGRPAQPLKQYLRDLARLRKGGTQ